MEVVASLSQGRTAAAQCGLFTHKSVPVIFEPPCMLFKFAMLYQVSLRRLCGGDVKDNGINSSRNELVA